MIEYLWCPVCKKERERTSENFVSITELALNCVHCGIAFQPIETTKRISKAIIESTEKREKAEKQFFERHPFIAKHKWLKWVTIFEG